ncbi:hypothetical protein [Brevibacterium pityocampae]|uniref:Lipoprotein n=1 Tax=Brevibacterium pityocampae TaxID=506594 RepID=A0ABP8J5Q0_9MICO
MNRSRARRSSRGCGAAAPSGALAHRGAAAGRGATVSRGHRRRGAPALGTVALAILCLSACGFVPDPRPTPDPTVGPSTESDAPQPAPSPLDPAETALRIIHRDSSVPPRYHRSYRLDADPSAAGITVSAYGSHIGQSRVEMDPDTWADAIAAAEHAMLSDQTCGGEPPPAGTKSTTLEVWVGDDRLHVIEGRNSCSRDGQAYPVVEEVAASLRGLFDEQAVFRPDEEPGSASAFPPETGAPRP